MHRDVGIGVTLHNGCTPAESQLLLVYWVLAVSGLQELRLLLAQRQAILVAHIEIGPGDIPPDLRSGLCLADP
jgi:hypothetical protein